MTTFKNKILEKHKSVYAFAKENGFSNQKAHYLANRDIKKMNQATSEYMCNIIGCKISDL